MLILLIIVAVLILNAAMGIWVAYTVEKNRLKTQEKCISCNPSKDDKYWGYCRRPHTERYAGDSLPLLIMFGSVKWVCILIANLYRKFDNAVSNKAKVAVEAEKSVVLVKGNGEND